MDRLFLGYETAFWIWRKAGPLAYSILRPTRVRSLAGGAPSSAKVESFLREHPDLATSPLDVIVRSGDQRRISGVKVHVRSHPMPDRSLYRLDDDVYVASPECCLVQLASKLTEAEAVKLAMEMCGSYALDVRDDEEGYCKRPALTSAANLKAFANRMYKPDGGARALHHLRYVLDNSASPRETALYMLLCMPPRFGGYGIALPEMNRRIELTTAEQLMVGARYFDCDLYWPQYRVAVEYDSTKYHTQWEKQERDAIRRNMLQYKGVQVIVATRQQVSSNAQFHKLALQIVRATGKRMRIPEEKHVVARSQLRKTLFEWDVLPNRSHESLQS